MGMMQPPLTMTAAVMPFAITYAEESRLEHGVTLRARTYAEYDRALGNRGTGSS
jgi:hypothetical protein